RNRGRKADGGDPGMSDNYQAILNHLLFHKALISEQEGGQRINRYLAMLNEIDQGQHVAVRDPFEKSVVAAFELALEKQLDPWEINLVPFTTLFMDKVRKYGAVNFVTRGPEGGGQPDPAERAARAGDPALRPELPPEGPRGGPDGGHRDHVAAPRLVR